MRTLVLCFAGLLGLGTTRAYYVIQADNGLYRGDWGFEEHCSYGGGNFTAGEERGATFVSSFDFKFETTNHIDNTAGNAVKLYCSDTSGHIVDYISSTEGNYGTWQGLRSCARGHYITGFRQRVLESQGTFGDDWGVDNVQVQCDDGTVLDGLDGVPPAQQDAPLRSEFRGDARMHGEWGSWALCPAGAVVSGVSTRVEQGHPFDDDAGLCDIIMFCSEV